MPDATHDLVTAYIAAVGERRLQDLPALLDPEAEFTLGDRTVHGSEAFVNAFRRLLPIIVRNDIRKLFVDGDEACVIYDFVTDTEVGSVLSVEYIKVRQGRIASSLLVFERQYWDRVVATMVEREQKQGL